EVWRLQETRCAEEQRLAVFDVLTQQSQRQTLSQQGKRQLVFLIAKRRGDLLKKRFVAAVRIDLIANSVGLLSQTELRRGIEHAVDAFFRQILQRRLATAGPRQRDIWVKRL